MTVAWDTSPTTVTVEPGSGLVNSANTATVIQGCCGGSSGSGFIATWSAAIQNDVTNATSPTTIFPLISLGAGTYHIDATVTFGSGSGSGAGSRIHSLVVYAGNPALGGTALFGSSCSYASQLPNAQSCSINYIFTLAAATDIYITGQANTTGHYAKATTVTGAPGASHYRILQIS